MKEGIRNKMVKKGRFDFRTASLQPAYFAVILLLAYFVTSEQPIFFVATFSSRFD